jgi:hypothetical protein
VGASKQRTTFSKLNRETKLREKRAAKEARKAARKLDAAREAEATVAGVEREPDSAE